MHRSRSSRRLLAAACLAFALAGAARAAAPLAPVHTFRFDWVEGGGGAAGDARLELGAVSADRAALRERRIVVRRRVAVRIDGPGPAVRLSVALGAELPGAVVRVDGVPVGTAPRVLDLAHRVGSSVAHQVEIIIPPGVSPGPFLTNLQWTAEPL